MVERIIIAGEGGQGIMLLGKVLAEAALREDKYTTWIPSYGAEVRGGAAYCMVIISDSEISSPYIDKADSLIVMNNPSFEKFKSRLKDKGLLIVNTTLVNKAIEGKNINICKAPFTYLAMKLGNLKVANMIALGCYLAQKNILNKNTVLAAIKAIAPAHKKNLVGINIKAFEEGFRIK
ncbi:MAG: 2-oxoacid:ferredoxin oxidoreductase subunit gamma [Candidatus Omnitrophota bacterium]|nr:MAG: 2-oxoacid:ferredoxin oxidoreductase subunit gamma [Candidatus Omnitrophota bacterium]